MKKTYIGYTKTTLEREPNELGESIEEMLRKATTSKEPIEATAPMIYTEKADGVQPQYDIRADRQEIALDMVEKAQKSAAMKTDEKPDTETKSETESETTFVTE